MAKKLTVDNMADRFGQTYKEIANQENLEYIVELGISSGLKDGWNTEKTIADAIDGKTPMEYARLILALQQRELLTKQCRLAEEALIESRKTNKLLERILEVAING